MESSPMDMWILGGFLGSGKTTMLNHLLAGGGSRRIGILVNDFGKLGIDAGLVEHGKTHGIIELNGGQIFCTCISGKFVEGVMKMAAERPDILLVESSGLAKPSALSGIMKEILSRSGGSLEYRGYVAVADAERSPKLLRAVTAVREQIVYADLVVINKTDLVSEEDVEELRKEILSLNPAGRVLETVFGELSFEDLPMAPVSHEALEKKSGCYAGWGEQGRPKAVTWRPEGLITDLQLEQIIREISPEALRIKGYLRTRQGLRFVSASGRQIVIEPADPPQADRITEGLTVIVSPRFEVLKSFRYNMERFRGQEQMT